MRREFKKVWETYETIFSKLYTNSIYTNYLYNEILLSHKKKKETLRVPTLNNLQDN